MALLYKILYRFIHSIFTIYEVLHNFYTGCLYRLLEFGAKLGFRKPAALELKKTPLHLTVILGTDQPSIQDLVDLVSWCWTCQIRFLSFYDHKGALQREEDRFRRALQAHELTAKRVTWGKGHKNGLSERQIYLKILSNNEGRGAIVDVIRNFSASNQHSFTVEEFEEKLLEKYEFPDPDMGLCCGKGFSLFGYPPWQIRVTEFFHIGAHTALTYDKFIAFLHSYSKCEQRYGK